MQEKDFEGLTGNERLDKIGRLHEFYNAVREKDADKMNEILVQICIGEQAVNAMFERYGIPRPKRKK